jgi:hypothetical protein
MNLIGIGEVCVKFWSENLKMKGQCLALDADWSTEWCTNFPRIWEPAQNCRRQKGDMERAPYRGATKFDTTVQIYSPRRLCTRDLCSPEYGIQVDRTLTDVRILTILVLTESEWYRAGGCYELNLWSPPPQMHGIY